MYLLLKHIKNQKGTHDLEKIMSTQLKMPLLSNGSSPGLSVFLLMTWLIKQLIQFAQDHPTEHTASIWEAGICIQNISSTLESQPGEEQGAISYDKCMLFI